MWPELNVIRDIGGAYWAYEHPEELQPDEESETYIPLALLEQQEKLGEAREAAITREEQRADKLEALLEQVEEKFVDEAAESAGRRGDIEHGQAQGLLRAAYLLRSMRQEAAK